MNRFLDQIVFVTGAGSGIGRAVALAFAREGAKVLINDLPNQAGIYLVKEQIESEGGQSVLKLGDVSSSENVKQLFEDVDHLDVMVNNAGFLREVPFVEMSDEEWDRMMKVHLYGTFYFARAAARIMSRQGKGRIINIASDLGQLGCERLAHYSAAKGGVITLTKSMARELGQSGILVNAVAPGGTLTPLVDALGVNYIAEESAKYPLKRLGNPEEIASTVLFLASMEASFMTGQVIGVNGGGVMNG